MLIYLPDVLHEGRFRTLELPDFSSDESVQLFDLVLAPMGQSNFRVEKALVAEIVPAFGTHGHFLRLIVLAYCALCVRISFWILNDLALIGFDCCHQYLVASFLSALTW